MEVPYVEVQLADSHRSHRSPQVLMLSTGVKNFQGGGSGGMLRAEIFIIGLTKMQCNFMRSLDRNRLTGKVS